MININNAMHEYRKSIRPTGINNSIHASIEIPDLKLGYVPGDIVQGVVKKVNATDAAETVSVVLKLVVRIKTQVTEESSNSDGKSSEWHYKGDRTLYDFTQPIFTGPAPPGISTWPFAIQLPDQFYDGRPNLPPTFYRPSESIRVSEERDYIYVEHLLEASICPATPAPWTHQQQRHSNPLPTATFPLYVRPRATTEPVRDPAPRLMFHEPDPVKTLRLDPAQGDKPLSFSQHMTSIFKRDTLPQFGYRLHVEAASVVQLEHPAPIHLRVRAEVARHPARTTSPALVDKPPELLLEGAKVTLQAATHVNDLEGRSRHVTGAKEGRWQDASVRNWTMAHWSGGDADGKVGTTNSTVRIPFNAPQGQGEQVESLDLGSMLGLRISSRDGTPNIWTKTVKPVFPSFTTNHVSHVHQLKYKLTILCAGKKRTIKGVIPVAVLTPSEVQERTRGERLDAMLPNREGVMRAHRAWIEGTVDVIEMAEAVTFAERITIQGPPAFDQPPAYNSTSMVDGGEKPFTKDWKPTPGPLP
ncbi:hypothetical protein JX265_012882 [Neoarthrinium moseri]|uniref:Arrestin-like N-terminal domain-containing protein n=1 Tax=Neoarthrinium moseri TaxID=1658444 RepID=A0A9P9WA04_9PEZI|nr:hypothetical protein JX266_012786 [Neoarthrinium moseri]KAI1852993.1 hypothetical protein JX265_012882 [Neoarthrinium moseri]